MNLDELLYEYIDENLSRVIISGAGKDAEISKIRIRPVMIQGKLMFQCTLTKGAQEIHKNYDKTQVIAQIKVWMESFRQLQLEGRFVQGQVLVSKKGKMTVKVKKRREEVFMPLNLEHNRSKRYILEEGTPVDFLVDLKVMTKEGKIANSHYDKFRQINRFLEFVEDILPQLPKEREVTILDFGCGKSYLTFAMYYYLHEKKGYDVNIIGLDLKQDVIIHCNKLAKKYGYEKLHFFIGDIASYEGVDQVDMVVTLHACDTATDFALAKAVLWGAQVILSVPCCQHELNGQIQNDMLDPVFSYGILKERMAALITDGLRGKILECAGYETQILEFIDMEHTPKNLLIRAVKKGQKAELSRDVRQCMEELHVQPTLAKLLFDE